MSKWRIKPLAIISISTFILSLIIFAFSFLPRTETCCEFTVMRYYGWPDKIVQYEKPFFDDNFDSNNNYSSMSISELKNSGFQLDKYLNNDIVSSLLSDYMAAFFVSLSINLFIWLVFVLIKNSF